MDGIDTFINTCDCSKVYIEEICFKLRWGNTFFVFFGIDLLDISSGDFFFKYWDLLCPFVFFSISGNAEGRNESSASCIIHWSVTLNNEDNNQEKVSKGNKRITK